MNQLIFKLLVLEYLLLCHKNMLFRNIRLILSHGRVITIINYEQHKMCDRSH